MDIVEQFDVENLTVEIHYDTDSTCFEDHFENDTDSLAIVCSFFHRRSVIGDHNPFSSVEEALDYAKKNDCKVFNLWRYEHGQVAFRAGEMGGDVGYPFNCQFDAGIEGFVIVQTKLAPAGYFETQGGELEFANSVLENLSDWCNGSIYGYVIKDDDGEELESCWGFLGYEYVEECARESANYLLQSLPKQLEMEGLAV